MKEKAIVDPGRIEEITIVPIQLKLDNFIAIVQIGLMDNTHSLDIRYSSYRTYVTVYTRTEKKSCKKNYSYETTST